MSPHDFITRWQAADLSERAACQSHFADLCSVLGQPKPTDVDPTGSWYAFEKGVDIADGKKGWADVWLKGKFGWEYKRKHRDLRANRDPNARRKRSREIADNFARLADGLRDSVAVLLANSRTASYNSSTSNESPNENPRCAHGKALDQGNSDSRQKNRFRNARWDQIQRSGSGNLVAKS